MIKQHHREVQHYSKTSTEIQTLKRNINGILDIKMSAQSLA